MILELNPAKWFVHKRPDTIDTPAHAAEFGPVFGVIPSAVSNEQVKEIPQAPEEHSMASVPAVPNPSATLYPIQTPPAGAPAKAAAVVAPTPKKPSEFRSILQHVVRFVTLGLADVIKYSAPVEKIAEVLFPEYAGLEREGQVKLNQVAQLLLTSVIGAQQKFATAPAGDETNAAKLADVLETAESLSLMLLQQAGIPQADAGRVKLAIDAIVAILKVNPAPAA